MIWENKEIQNLSQAITIKCKGKSIMNLNLETKVNFNRLPKKSLN